MSKVTKAKAPILPDGEETAAVFEVIEKESDRGAVLVVGAWLDELLGALLATKLVDHAATLKDLFGGPSAPLGSFSARINMAHGLGLIAEDEWNSLHKMRGVRNAAAHFDKKADGRGFVIDFDDEKLTAKVMAIDLLAPRIKDSVKNAPKPSRWLFNIAGAVLVGRLMARLKEKTQPTARPTTDWGKYWGDFIDQNKDASEEAAAKAT